METSFAAAAVLLFLVVDPLGNIPLFSGILNRYPIRKRRRIIVRETIISFFVLLLFMLTGERFLQLMHLTEWALQIGGAMVLFLIAIRMIFPHPEGIMGVASSDQEPFIVPLSIPGIIYGDSDVARRTVTERCVENGRRAVGGDGGHRCDFVFCRRGAATLGRAFYGGDGASDGDDFGRGVGADVAHGRSCVLGKFALMRL